MEFTVRRAPVFEGSEKIECLWLPVFEGEAPLGLAGAPEALREELTQWVAKGEFSQESSRTFVYYPRSDRIERVLLIALGKRDKLNAEVLRSAMGHAVKAHEALPVKAATLPLDKALWVDASGATAAAACVEGASFAEYRYEGYKTKKKENTRPKLENLIFCIDEISIESAVQFAQVACQMANMARDLGNRPANKLTPTMLADEARRMAADVGASCRVIEKDELKALGMELIMAVGKGSAEPPVLIAVDTQPGGPPPVCFVGKGVTFDSGGISIKPADSMEDMKFDMGGAAAALAAACAAKKLGLPRVVAVVPAVENMPSGTAMKPSDVFTSLSGKSVEIINTDAEGRLILADALTWAEREFQPRAIIDLATLTGACVVALGHVAAGLMSKDAALSDALKRASEATGEPIWPLPLAEPFAEQLKSAVADLKNLGTRWGGAITAGTFLSNFVEKTPWAHLDIAGVAWDIAGKSYIAKGATGFGVRLLLEYLRQLPTSADATAAASA